MEDSQKRTSFTTYISFYEQIQFDGLRLSWAGVGEQKKEEWDQLTIVFSFAGARHKEDGRGRRKKVVKYVQEDSKKSGNYKKMTVSLNEGQTKFAL